ncbi:hypothetical protein FACS1894208_03040 [Clostridia bacterium]|nr:hypothetical protein FACS1894208_03040 [Clostridia bacterium]
MRHADISEREGGFPLESYRIENLTFTYPGRENPAVRNLNLTVRRGEFLALCGASGCGKTTLLRHLKPSSAPHGTLSGEIFFENARLSELPRRAAASDIGVVMQSPENQIVTDKVWHELAFGLESLGLKTSEIRLRVAEMAAFFGISEWFHRDVAGLSGGQKQLLNLASVMVTQPRVLILDEPTSRLDPIAASEFLAAVGKINRELGVTVIVAEHRLDEVFPLCDRAAVMERGELTAIGTPSEIAASLYGAPAPARIWAYVKNDLPCPVTVRDGRLWLAAMPIVGELPREDVKAKTALPPALELDKCWFRYEKNAADVLKGLSFKAYGGEIAAILGGNGTGKSTALSLLAGLNKPYRGKVTAGRSVAMLPQNPQTLFTRKTVGEDLREMSDDEERVRGAAALCRLDALLDCHPYDLSGGEQQRAALAKVLLTDPKILLLDEPTKGLDAEFKPVFAGLLRKLTAAGVAVVLVSHDTEFCAEYADRCAMLFDGAIVSEGTPRAFFSGNSFYTTPVSRMAREVLPLAVTVDDVVVSLGGERQQLTINNEQLTIVEEAVLIPPVVGGGQRRFNKRVVLAWIFVLVAVPLTIFVGVYWFGDRKYFVVSLLIVFETMIPFFLAFEGRKPAARELVTIAVLCAVGVAARAAFFMLPNFKPVTAVVIISGLRHRYLVAVLLQGATARRSVKGRAHRQIQRGDQHCAGVFYPRGSPHGQDGYRRTADNRRHVCADIVIIRQTRT